MADIDNDILALAGDSPADEPQTPANLTTPAKSESAATPASASPTEKEAQASPAKSPASKRRAPASTDDEERPVKKSKRTPSDDQGEATAAQSSSPSLRSASMSESASDDSPTGSKNQPIRFPIEGKFASQADKAEVMALPEVQREEILAERATMMERDQQNRALMQLLKDKERTDAKDISAVDKKRKAGAMEPEESQRKSARQKTALGGRKVGEGSAPLEEYKRQREQKGAHSEPKRKEEGGKKSQKRDDGVPDVDAGAESEGEWREVERPKGAAAPPPRAAPAPASVGPSTGARAGRAPAPRPAGATHPAAPVAAATASRAPAPPHQEPVADLGDFNAGWVGRFVFSRFCYHPGFEAAITGCLVRVRFPGPDNKGGSYRVGLVKMFKDGAPYAMEGFCETRFITQRYVVLSQGNHEKMFPFIFLSDQGIAQREYEQFKWLCARDKVPMPTRSALRQKRLDVQRLVTRKLTPAELNEKLALTGSLLYRRAPILRAEIHRDRREAVERGDEAAIARCDARLRDLNGPTNLAFGTKLFPDPPKPAPVPDDVAAANARNRQLKAMEALETQRRQREAQQRLQVAIARGEVAPDPCARVKTVAKTMYDHSDYDRKKRAESTKDLDDLFEDPDEANTAAPPPPPPAKVESAPVPAPATHTITKYMTPQEQEEEFSRIVQGPEWDLDPDLVI